MRAVTIVKQINTYLPELNTRQQAAVLTMVKTFAEDQEQAYSPWKEPGFLEELDQRMAELESGKVKGDSWEAVKQKARQSVKAKKKK